MKSQKQLNDEEEKYDRATGLKTGTGEIGDLAHLKWYVGGTAIVNKYLPVTLRGRYIGARNTVIYNPVGEVDGYFTMDANLMVNNILHPGISLALKVTNLTDTEYFHPGIQDGNAGTTEGVWSGLAFVGSQGWSNSLLPQPGRIVSISLLLDL